MFYRARFIRAFLFPGEESGKLQKIAKKVFLAPKPPPTIESKFKNRYLQQKTGFIRYYILLCAFLKGGGGGSFRRQVLGYSAKVKEISYLHDKN